MDKAYNHSEEESIYKKWEESGAFSPNETGKPFTIIMPPPNANDPLHLGHAMFVSVEDILIRYNRLKGDATLWLPGTDHAGIETQFVYEKKLGKENKSRFDFDRETLYDKIWNYVQENSGTSIKQMKRLGASADWNRYTFTLEPSVIDFVYDTFIKLHTEGLIYRSEKLVNYCVKCGTGYSELEIEYEERVDPLYYVKYQLKDSDETITVATVRPEPIFADTHLAVNPNDKKKKYLIGKQVINPLTGAIMDIIGDDFVDPEFGTGIVKLTPAHDQNDFEAAVRHGLPINQAITVFGKLTQLAGPWADLKVNEARKQIVEFLKAKNAIEKIDEKYSHRIGTCYRCHSVIEPLPLPQFFVNVKPLTEKALKALSKKQVKIHGAGREKILINWLKNLRDWNISRQIVWGIRIPVWYDTEKNPQIEVTFLTSSGEKKRGSLKEILVVHSIEEVSKGLQNLVAPKESSFIVSKTSPGKKFLQETDTFDTWFSSGQWPVVTLKIREGDFERFYPTSVMETAYDILPFWVMRMLMLGLYLTDEVPFKEVYFHGLIRDGEGRKMSKSIGNVINPIDMVEKYGADAIRMALVMSTTAGTDKNVSEQNIKGMRNFSNKIWNAARFLELLETDKDSEVQLNEEFQEELNSIVKDVTNSLEKLKVGLAAEIVYDKFWHWYCDWAIEKCKEGSISKDKMLEGLKTFLILLHPFAPFVTEACYGEIFAKDKSDLLISASWPKVE